MEIRQILKEKFGFERFRPGQEEVVRSVLAENDTIAILPTGVGKSLCYQLPAYALPGVILIISPLVSLMEDQVARMKRNGEKRVVALNSFLQYKEKQKIIHSLAQYKFIFISPEMLMQPTISRQLKSIKLSLIVVDEAHCISQWGFDFRPDYLRIGDFCRQTHRPKILALTATADDKVVEDIIHYLNLENPSIHRRSLDRPNISFAIRKMESKQEKTTWIQKRVQETIGPGIIYVSSRKRADELSSYLINQGISIASYHAGMEQVDRAFTQEQFIRGETQWICATNAFGMGIHKNDIRQVIHEHFPATLAGYIQEVGRAGRDGEQSAATLLYAADDEGRTRFITQEDLPNTEEIQYYCNLLTTHIKGIEAAERAGLSETAKRVIDYYLERMSMKETIHQIQKIGLKKEKQLEQILQVIHSDKCIRQQILSFFGEEIESQQVSCCSICGLNDMVWILKDQMESQSRKPMEWKVRLEKLLS